MKCGAFNEDAETEVGRHCCGFGTWLQEMRGLLEYCCAVGEYEEVKVWVLPGGALLSELGALLWAGACSAQSEREAKDVFNVAICMLAYCLPAR